MRLSMTLIRVLALLACCELNGLAAVGDIASVTIRADGWSADVVIEGFSAGATYSFGLGPDNSLSGNEKLQLSVTSLGFDGDGNPTIVTRSIVGTKAVRKVWPDQAQTDETVAEGNLSVRIALSDPVYAKDTNGGPETSGVDVVGNVLSGLVINTAGGGQSSAPRSGFTVVNQSTLNYPKVIGRWAWPGFERVTGDFLIEAVCFSPFGRNGRPLACVKFDCVDAEGVAAPQQTATAMTLSPRLGDANRIWTYSATMPVSDLTQGAALTCRFRAFPWIGDSDSILDTDPSADGIAAPSESLSPLMLLCDKDDVLACYASVDGVGAGTPSVQTTAELARDTPYSTLAAALIALKAYNSTNHSDNSLNNCIVLMQNGTYSGPSTFTGANSKSVCIIKSDAENGATESGVIFSTATNQACNAYLKFEDVTFAGASSGLLRGHQTGGLLWLHSCTLSNTSVSYIYQWRVCFATQNTITATSATGFKQFATNRGAFALIRGNNASSITGGMVANVYCVLGNRGVQHGSGFTESGAANDLSENAIVAWNSVYNMTVLYCNEFFLSSSTNKGLAIVGNVAEKISNSNPFVRIAGDNANTSSLSNVLIAHNTFAGQRQNLNYHEGGNVSLTRENWFDCYNLFRDFNTKTEVFANAARTLNDGVVNGTTTLTSATANFTSADVGVLLTLDEVPNGETRIASVTNSTTIVMNSAATVTATDVRFGVNGYIANPYRTSNWAWLYGVGCRGSRYEISNFPRDFPGIDVSAVGSQLLGYVNDRSQAGAGGGNGDYSLIDSSPAHHRVPAGEALIPGDLNGVRLNNTGSGAAGAIQPQSATGLLNLRRRGLK